MFFALIRRMNGFTNNPTTVQFQSAYKKLLVNKMDILVPGSANCVPQDNTLLIINDNEMNSAEHATCSTQCNETKITKTILQNAKSKRQAFKIA